MNIKTIFQPLLKKGFQKISEVIETYILSSEKGAVNGVATLDSNMKLTASQLPDSVLGQVQYQGLWNAGTNSPTLPTTPTAEMQAHFYIVSAPGTFAGITFAVGDWILEAGGTWQKVDNTDAVSSVFGRTGNVLPDGSDYAAFYASLVLANTFTQKQTAPQFESNVATGTPPFVVASTTEVVNLFAEKSGRLFGITYSSASSSTDVLSPLEKQGMTYFLTTTGATNLPAEVGTGVIGSGYKFSRANNAYTVGDSIWWRRNNNAHPDTYFNYIVSVNAGVATWAGWTKILHSGNHPRSLVTVSASEPTSPQDGDFWIVP